MWVDAVALSVLGAWLSLGWELRGAEGLARGGQGTPCSFTFLLPALETGRAAGRRDINILQRDWPPSQAGATDQKFRQLETSTRNNSQWLHKLESYIVDNSRSEMVHLQQSAVQNHTVTMLEIGTDLLSQTVERSRRLTDIEAQLLNQTLRIEIQLLENSLCTNKLEKQLLLQTHDISRIHDRSRLLERKVFDMEARHRSEVGSLKRERERLQQLLTRQVGTVGELERRLNTAGNDSADLQRQQLRIMGTVQRLITLVSQGRAEPKKEEKIYADCSEAFASGATVSGVYTIRIRNVTDPRQVYCDMETGGGGWTVIQRRFNGSLDFQRNWTEYKLGFGESPAEHWLGNEAIHRLTSQRAYSLRIELRDWDANHVYGFYERFRLSGERKKYRLFVRGYRGTAGLQSSLAAHGASFSTKDADNDNCYCKCALLLTGGWWFDACGLSNLNGMYYAAGNHLRKLNGIKWHYFRNPSYSLQATTMMIRPLDF
ncbi:angiopoietin-1 [Leucoraja erinacea]|uniref:angiopoietin-1 n=1 Tax=Leucoraja erinaceus TaxID=7782 RepID=UPI00245630F6|nr:angiopoietin-1 [Leucoraja erinacea]